MANDENYKDPFNWTYFLIFVVTLLALPLVHVVLGWLKFYFWA